MTNVKKATDQLQVFTSRVFLRQSFGLTMKLKICLFQDFEIWSFGFIDLLVQRGF